VPGHVSHIPHTALDILSFKGKFRYSGKFKDDTGPVSLVPGSDY